ncbi:hypothetical protein ACIP4U_02935 [Streptomyces caelestis]|uniref:hypothetical protein n=1 Tax=Streptomyces caelestis TaxID=36816 RepID=UPI003816240E
MLDHCAHARYVWNLAVEQHSHWSKGRGAAPGFAEQCRQLTEARRENEWLRAGNADVQQQALKDFAKAKNARFTSGLVSRRGAGSTCTRASASSAPTGSRSSRRTGRRS